MRTRILLATALFLSAYAEAAPPAIETKPAPPRSDAMIDVQGRLITLTRADLRELGLLIKPDGGPIQNIIIDDKAVKAVMDLIRANITASLVTSPRLTLRDGQEAKCQMGTDIPYTADFVPIDKAGKVQNQPQIKHVQTGFDWTVRGTLVATNVAGGNVIRLTTHPKNTFLVKMQKIRWNNVANGNGKILVDSPLLDVREATTTIDVPAGKTLVLELNGNVPSDRPTLMLIKPTLAPLVQPPTPPADQQL